MEGEDDDEKWERGKDRVKEREGRKESKGD